MRLPKDALTLSAETLLLPPQPELPSRTIQKETLLEAIEQAKQNPTHPNRITQQQVADILGVSERQIRQWLDQFDIDWHALKGVP